MCFVFSSDYSQGHPGSCIVPRVDEHLRLRICLGSLGFSLLGFSGFLSSLQGEVFRELH